MSEWYNLEDRVRQGLYWLVGVLLFLFIFMMLLSTCACTKPVTNDSEIINSN